MKYRPLSVVAICIATYCQHLQANPFDLNAEHLETITVSDESEENILNKKLGETKKTAQSLSKQQASDSRDLVRYETGITVVETGRSGSSGYAVRGVDENRVGIMIDGLQQAETLSSQGFKELFEGYGNFNNSRNSAEIETLKQVSILKGANSVKVGSGALGGAVIFETKDARDFLIDKNYHLAYKTGYTTQDNQLTNSLTLAGRYKWFDLLLIKTKREGHELENYDYKTADGSIQGKLREKTDPYSISKDSTLAKFSFSPTENHRFTLVADLYKNTTRGHDFSYSLNYSQNYNAPEKELRHTNDKSERSHYSFVYENYNSNPLWDSLKFTYSNQKIQNRARTDEYCDSDNCEGILNPIGIQIQNGKIVDQQGNTISLATINGVREVVDSDGNPFPYDENYSTHQLKSATSYWFDCSLYDCNSPVTVYSDSDYDGVYETEELALERTYTDENGNTFASIAANKWGRYVVLPPDKGYLDLTWTRRDLNTKTHQFNLDLTKQLNTWNIPHNLEYGAIYNQTKKEMVNQSGYSATNVQWWADRFLGLNLLGVAYSCETAYSWDANLCPQTDPEYSFLLPVVTKNGAIYFTDNIQLNSYVSFDVGYRYDRINYKPSYEAGVTPKLPDDLVKGLYIPLPNGEPCSWCASGYYDPSDEQIAQNALDNINYIAQKKKFQAHSYVLATTIDPLNFLRLQLKYAKGFRAPTADEIYFTFKHPDFTILPNLDLQPETSQSGEVALTLHNQWGFISASLFRTKYRHFIDLDYLGQRSYSLGSGGTSLPFSVYQNVNRNNAAVNGFDLNASLNLGLLNNMLDGVNLSYKYTYQKGRMNGDIPMNAIQPKTAIYGLGYHQENKFGFDLYVTHVGKKAKQDTYNIYYQDQGLTDSSIKWHSGSYTLVDIIGYLKPLKNLTLQVGVYNLTNRKYLTWESARSIKPFGTSNLIDQDTGLGINRFYSAGRNFKLNAEFSF